MFALIIFVISVFRLTASADSFLTENSCGMMVGNSSESQQRFSFSILRHDFDGIPVIMQNWGAWDLLWLTDHQTEMKRFGKNYEKLMVDIESGDLFRKFSNETTDLHVTNINFDGFNQHHIFLLLYMNCFVKCSTLNKTVPGVSKLAYGIFVNANPVADQMINMIKPFVGNQLERFEVFGTNSNKWIPRLLKHIPANQLPPALGGTKEFKPVATCDLA